MPTAPPPAQTVYSTVDVIVPSCGPGGKKALRKKEEGSGIDTNTVSSCPGKPAPPASYPAGTGSSPVGGSSATGVSVPTGPKSSTSPSSYTSTPPAPPASSIPSYPVPPNTYLPATTSSSPVAPPRSSSVAPPPAGYSSAPSGRSSNVGPYPTSVVTVVSSSKGPAGTGTGAVPAKNAT